MSTAWAKGSTRAWRRLRARILHRDAYTCQLKLPGVCTGQATQVHHTVGRAISGDDPAYLVAACAPCNLKTGQPDTGKFTAAPQTTQGKGVGSRRGAGRERPHYTVRLFLSLRDFSGARCSRDGAPDPS